MDNLAVPGQETILPIDPPAYSRTPTEGTSTVPTPILRNPRRTILETRALILGNAAIFKPRRRDDDVQLVVTRHKSRQESAEEIRREQHYAFLVMRRPSDTEISIVLKSEPRDSIEEALECMLERTEGILEEMLLRHGKDVSSLGCCGECGRIMRPDRFNFRMGEMR